MSMFRGRHIDGPAPDLSPLTQQSMQALLRLSQHVSEPEPCPSSVPAYRRAAVLLGLFGGRNGELYVVLSKRSTGLRSHGGDTAIPGGRYEPSDASLEATARREAWEECGLPVDPDRVRKLCELRPFLSANELLVTPIVVHLIDPLIKPVLNPYEVDLLFSLPLESFLHHQPPKDLRPSLRLPLRHPPTNAPSIVTSEVSPPSDWHTCRDAIWLGGYRYRRHTFWDTRNPVMGLTSDILIHCASIAFAAEPAFSLVAPSQPGWNDLIRMAFTGPLAVKKRRVKPRFQNLPQPVDESETLGEGRDPDAGAGQGGSNPSRDPHEIGSKARL